MLGIPDFPRDFPDSCAQTALVFIVELRFFVVFVFPIVKHLVNQALDIPFGPIRLHLCVEFPTSLPSGLGLSGPVPAGRFANGIAVSV